MNTLVVNCNPKAFRSLTARPLFSKTRFRQAGRLLTAKEFAARRLAVNQVRKSQRNYLKSAEIAAFLAQELETMCRIADSVAESHRVARFFASHRAIRNHSTQAMRNRSSIVLSDGR